jgi:acyl-CoA synthetase (AMP-forming)/AMP-acid ligase II
VSLFSILAVSARRYPDAGAVYHGTDRFATYGELQRRSLALAHLITQWAPQRSRVMLASANRPEYPEIMFGVWAAGMTAVPVNAKLHARELCELLQDSQAALVFASEELAPAFAKVGVRVVRIGSDEYAAALAGPHATAVDGDRDGLAWIFYTSGTTGRSKGAMLSHRNLLNMGAVYLADLEQVEKDHSLIHAAPMSHGSGMCMIPYTMRGARHVVPRSGGFEPAEFLALANLHPGGGAFLAPTMVRRLRLHMQGSARRAHGMRAIVYGGGPMYLEEIRQALQTFGPVMVQLYGQGESPMTITGLRQNEHIAAGDDVLSSVGWARSGVEVRIVDEEGRDRPVGETGEVVCRSDITMKGYWNNPGATAAAIRDGWLYTGDLGCLDASGLLTLKDRSKDVIISGGTNIYPREVEEVLLAHADVAEVSVVGQPDIEWGETVVAFVVPREGTKLTSERLDAYCLENIARFKRPKRYIFETSLPKNNYGKVMKRELAARLRTHVGSKPGPPEPRSLPLER